MSWQSPASKVSSIVHGGRQDHRRTPSRVHECVQLKRVGYQRRFSQHAGVRAERLDGPDVGKPKPNQAGTRRTGQVKCTKQRCIPQGGVNKTGSLFGPRTFHPRPLRPLFVRHSRLMRKTEHVTPPACVREWCPVVVRSSQCSFFAGLYGLCGMVFVRGLWSCLYRYSLFYLLARWRF